LQGGAKRLRPLGALAKRLRELADESRVASGRLNFDADESPRGGAAAMRGGGLFLG